MAFLRSLVESRGISPKDIWGKGHDWEAAQNIAGVRVNQDTGSRLAASYACIRVLAESCGSLPWDNFRKRFSDDNQEVKVERVKPPKWMTQPNRETSQTRQELIETALWSLNTDGNFYAGITFDAQTYPYEVFPLDPKSVEPNRNKYGEIVYTIDGKDFPRHQILHVKGLTWPGSLKGVSPIEWCRRTFALGISAEEYGAAFFGNGAHPGSVIELDNDPGEPAVTAMARRWRKAHGGVKKSNLPAVLTHGAQWKQVTIPNDNAQFLETRKFSRSEIAGIFHVPPHMIGDLERATFSNIEHQSVEFVRYSLRPWLERLEGRFNQLLPRGQFVKFNAEGLLRGTTRDRYASYSVAVQNGWMNRNEVRAKEDMPRIEDPIGDQYMVQANIADPFKDNKKEED